MVEFKIVQRIAVIGEKNNGWKLELNRVKWNNLAEKLDLRTWNEDHTRCGKGITFSEEEAATLCAVLEGLI